MRKKRNLAEVAQFVLASFESLGVKVSRTSRLGQMHRLLVQPDGNSPTFVAADHPQFAVAREAMRDLLQLGFVFDELLPGRVPRDMPERLRRVVCDAALPQENLTASQGRDAQCELYVAAMCAKAGLLRAFEEPDLHCGLGEHAYSVAVKRIKSWNNGTDRIKDAAEQIGRSGRRGVVVADMTVALNRGNTPFVAPVPDEVYGQVAREEVRRFFASRFLTLAECVRGKNVYGLIVLSHDIRHHPVGGWSLESVTSATHLSPYNERRREQFGAFARQFIRGTPTASL